MAVGDVIVGIDIGSSKVSTFVGEVNNFNQIETICNTSSKCSAIKKGIITDEEELSMSINRTISEAEDIAGIHIGSAYTTIPGKYITIVQNSIVKDTKDKLSGITFKDVAMAIIQVRDVQVPDNKVLIDIVPDKFILDDGKAVDDPIGKFSNNFTLTAQVILADKEYIRKLKSVFKKCDLEIDGVVPISLAERNLVLESSEFSNNIMILDIGAGNTEIGIFNGSTFVYTNTIFVGGDNITNDIQYVLNISREEADKLKKQYGLALKSFIDNDNNIVLNTSRAENSRNATIKSSLLVEIIEARVEEIFSLVNDDIISHGIKNNINTVVLTGDGIVNINKSDTAGKIALNIPVKIANGRLMNTVSSSQRLSYALVRYIAARPYAKTVSSNVSAKVERHLIKNLLRRIRDFFYT